MLNEVTRLTKGDFSRFENKKYQVKQIVFVGTSVISKRNLERFDTRDEAIKYLNELDKKNQDKDVYFKIKEVYT